MNDQPVPIASNNGCAMIALTHDRLFRMRLFTATPMVEFFGVNSVSIVMVTLVRIIPPNP